MDTTVIMDTTTRTLIGKPNGEDLDPPRVDTAGDNATVAESLCALATSLEQDRGVATAGLGRTAPAGKP